jgi:hypothetical protein
MGNYEWPFLTNAPPFCGLTSPAAMGPAMIFRAARLPAAAKPQAERTTSLPNVEPMATILITAKAFAAIDATLLQPFKAEGQPDDKGGYLLRIQHAKLNRLAQLRRPRESYSDVILRLAKG